ncbi:hypothetical protein ACHAWF_012029 [Thalassiosira exigua]
MRPSLTRGPSRPPPPVLRSRKGGRRWRASTLRCLLLTSALFSLALWIAAALLGLDPSSDAAGAEEGAEDETRGRGSDRGVVAAPGGPNLVRSAGAPRPRATVAYAVSLTSCGASADRHDNIANGGHSSDPSFHEGAAVLKHSIHLSSIRNYEESKSLFDYEMIAFVHPQAERCSGVFEELGYQVQIRETPFNVTDIKRTFLREHIGKSGCCGEKEYLKLYAYRLEEYPVVVHLDLDSLILKPLDDLFLAMLGEGGGNDAADEARSKEVVAARSRIPVMFDDPLPKSIDAYFTRDYNMVNPGKKYVGVQGGFLIVKPSLDAFNEYVNIVLEGRFFQGSGWEGKGYGGYFGAQQIQGICSFYYDYRHPGTAVELNKCRYNAMADAPRQKSSGKCRDGREECEDCRDAPIEAINSVHFTLCSKPWKCPSWVGSDEKMKNICSKFHGEWFRIREDLDRKNAEKSGREYVNPNGRHRPEVFRGYCRSNGERGYIPIGS